MSLESYFWHPCSFEEKHRIISIDKSLDELGILIQQIQSILLQEIQNDQTSLLQPLREGDKNILRQIECSQNHIQSITRNERVGCEIDSLIYRWLFH